MITSRGRKEGGWDQSGGHKKLLGWWVMFLLLDDTWVFYTIQYTINLHFCNTTVKHYALQRNANQGNHCYRRERVLGLKSKALIWISDWQLIIWVTLKVKSESSQSCPTLFDPMDCIVHGILQAKILEWLAFPFSRGSSQPRDQTQVSHIAGGFFTSWARREAQEYWSGSNLGKSYNLSKPQFSYM